MGGTKLKILKKLTSGRIREHPHSIIYHHVTNPQRQNFNFHAKNFLVVFENISDQIWFPRFSSVTFSVTSYPSHPENLIRKAIRSSKNLRIYPKLRSGGILGNFCISIRTKIMLRIYIKKWSGDSNSWSGTRFHWSGEKMIEVGRKIDFSFLCKNQQQATFCWLEKNNSADFRN